MLVGGCTLNPYLGEGRGGGGEGRGGKGRGGDDVEPH